MTDATSKPETRKTRQTALDERCTTRGGKPTLISSPAQLDRDRFHEDASIQSQELFSREELGWQLPPVIPNPERQAALQQHQDSGMQILVLVNLINEGSTRPPSSPCYCAPHRREYASASHSAWYCCTAQWTQPSTRSCHHPACSLAPAPQGSADQGQVTAGRAAQAQRSGAAARSSHRQASGATQSAAQWRHGQSKGPRPSTTTSPLSRGAPREATHPQSSAPTPSNYC